MIENPVFDKITADLIELLCTGCRRAMDLGETQFPRRYRNQLKGILTAPQFPWSQEPGTTLVQVCEKCSQTTRNGDLVGRPELQPLYSE